MDYIKELETLEFLKSGQNLVIWGPPGTGKSWFLTCFATKACEQGLRVRMITFTNLCRMLETARAKNRERLDSQIKYFSNFDVVCIDEFPYDADFDAFKLQGLFCFMETKDVRIMISSQSPPENWPKLLVILSLGQSITGRIAGNANAKRLQFSGPDLRYRHDLDLD